jgi:hypothetical protein
MHNYLGRLENKISNTNVGKIIFNKYYNVLDLYWTLFYAISISILAGIGNSIVDLNSGNIFYLLSQGFINNIYLSLLINIFYPKIISKLSDMPNLRRNGNLFWAFIFALFVAWHYILGTENPILANIPPNLAALILTNYQISILIRKMAKYNN